VPRCVVVVRPRKSRGPGDVLRTFTAGPQSDVVGVLGAAAALGALWPLRRWLAGPLEGAPGGLPGGAEGGVWHWGTARSGLLLFPLPMPHTPGHPSTVTYPLLSLQAEQSPPLQRAIGACPLCHALGLAFGGAIPSRSANSHPAIHNPHTPIPPPSPCAAGDSHIQLS